jgi:hypothetical protein
MSQFLKLDRILFTFFCLDFKTGEILWRDRDAPKGSLAFADGRLYLRAEDGE